MDRRPGRGAGRQAQRPPCRAACAAEPARGRAVRRRAGRGARHEPRRHSGERGAWPRQDRVARAAIAAGGQAVAGRRRDAHRRRVDDAPDAGRGLQAARRRAGDRAFAPHLRRGGRALVRRRQQYTRDSPRRERARRGRARLARRRDGHGRARWEAVDLPRDIRGRRLARLLGRRRSAGARRQGSTVVLPAKEWCCPPRGLRTHVYR